MKTIGTKITALLERNLLATEINSMLCEQVLFDWAKSIES